MSTQPTVESASERTWHALDIKDVTAALQADDQGLTSAEAGQRLAVHGPNTIETSSATPWIVTLLRQFVSPMIGILLAAFVITMLLREYVDAGAIALILALNAGLGFWQERKSARDVRALATLSAPNCTVVRDGAAATRPAADLVPGDVVHLESGDRVPADVRLLDAKSLQVDESMLTGESEAVTKQTGVVTEEAPVGDRINMAFSGTLVRSGRARALVVATGTGTELGVISELIKGPPGKTPLQELTNGLERKIGVIITAVSAVLFFSGVALGNAPGEMFLTIVALAVASLPESLPIVLTVAMSVGVSRMAKRHALVRSLPAVETLGSTTVIGSDKTGTLTMNEMTSQAGWTTAGEVELTDPGLTLSPAARQMLLIGALTNEARPDRDDPSTFIGDAVDVAMAKAALRTGAVTMGEFTTAPLAHAPYESEARMSQSIHRVGDDRVLFVKGSPDALLAASVKIQTDDGVAPLDLEVVQSANHHLASRGLRMLGTAFRVLAPGEQIPEELPAPSGLTFAGLQGMADPPRPGVAEAIAACHRAGIWVLMITGDQPATALAIAAQLGLPTEAEPLTGAEILTLDDEALRARLRRVGVAARVSPQDKMRIVQVLQDSGEVVAVTGDGVNDAPALKAAALGVAMGASGTDVARESADMVLTDDNFVTVVDAVEQGRVTFNAIRKATHFLLANGAASLLAVSISVYTDMPLIFLPIQMLFMNVVTNGVQDIALGFEGAEGDELNHPPRSAKEGVLSRVLWWRTVIAGAWMGLAAVGMFLWGLNEGLAEEHARTLTMTLFVMMNFFFVQTSRFEHKSVLSDPFSNRLLVVSSFAALALFWVAVTWPVVSNLMGFVPLSGGEWALCAALGVSVLVIVEAEKWVRRRLTARQHA
ncbi:cation-translocating P-type ATPase [Pseudactinotalea sp. Z1739]|uniref:cation-translocating P-type ATPase n=1 Tax=Pseudactinotalea sp. Z1739 TaxID=3413028 RepID=UPI003C7A6917